jgi:hypothetical protein
MESRMRIHAIALCLLLAAGCSAPDDDANAPPIADVAATTPESTAAAGDDGTNIVPARFQGDYAVDTPACSTPAHESRLTIGAWRIKFHESSGAITAVDSNDEGDIAITAELSGEGETRRATYYFNLSTDGQTLTDTDSGMKRRRC